MKHLLPIAEVEAVAQALDMAFHGLRRHDLWDATGRLMCADSKAERLAKLRETGLDDLSFRDLDDLMSCAGLTIGTGETVRFLTPRYLKALLSFPEFGWYTNGQMLRDRLDRHGFDEWPKDQRLATADAMALMGRAMVLLADDYNDHPEVDGTQLIAWANIQRATVQAEAERRKHKAGVKRLRGGKGLRR